MHRKQSGLSQQRHAIGARPPGPGLRRPGPTARAERPGRTHRQNQEQKLGAGRRSLHRGHAAEDPADFPPSSVMFCFFFNFLSF